MILVVVDTLRADHLTQAGYGRATSVALDDFVGHATGFTHCYSPSSWTTPSIASLLTGMSPIKHGATEFGAVLSPAATTLPELLQAGGWRTVGISFNPNITAKREFDQGFDVYEEYSGGPLKYPDIRTMVGRVGELLEDASDPGPLFLYLQPMNVHGPYKVPQGRRSALLGRPPDRAFRYYGPEMKGILRRGELELRDGIDEAFVDSLVEQYDTAIRYTTDQLSALFELLSERGLYDDALIVLTSDHGEELFEHGGFSHGFSLHEEVLHIPLYVKLPGQESAQTVSTTVTLLDLYPTIADLLGLSSGSDLDGRSFAPLLHGETPPMQEPTRLHHTSWEGRCEATAIVSGAYKLVRIRSNYEGVLDETRLYDLEADPEEERDVAAEHPEVVRGLGAALEERLRALEAAALDDAGTRMDEEDLERLRAIGYVDGDS